jgi:hypothetical protein
VVLQVGDRVKFVGRPSKDLPFGVEGIVEKLTTIHINATKPDCYFVKFDCGLEFSDFSEDELRLVTDEE